MIKQEITKKIKLNDKDFNKMLYHSVLNTMNVLKSIINTFESHKDTVFSDTQQMLDKMIASIVDENKRNPKNLQTSILKSLVISDMEKLKELELDDTEKNMLDFLEKHFESIFLIMKKRITELNIWGDSLTHWEYFQVDEVCDDIKEFFNVLSGSSNHKFGVEYVPHALAANAYYVDIDITGDKENNILMPAFMLNIILDLAANSRRYTKTPGTIGIELRRTDELVELMVSDTGMGMDKKDLNKYIDFGKHGEQNRIIYVPVGGYGLSKAYYITKLNNGRFWIETEKDQGTTITIQIPNI